MTTGDAQSRTFEASLEALERIVQQLEDGDLPLEKSLELFEQGIKLSRECQERLSQAERRIEILLRDNQGRPVVSPFNETTTNEDDDERNGF
ncbi:MAG: exodeoxyribonuclease VII small subunit [Blastocatellia bacterium]|nr:MAG: exodeoxyribonuclease VII small subunit [Blastocatellia bacterium]